jgi:site-specific recombinase XerD
VWAGQLRCRGEGAATFAEAPIWRGIVPSAFRDSPHQATGTTSPTSPTSPNNGCWQITQSPARMEKDHNKRGCVILDQGRCANNKPESNSGGHEEELLHAGAGRVGVEGIGQVGQGGLNRSRRCWREANSAFLCESNSSSSQSRAQEIPSCDRPSKAQLDDGKEKGEVRKLEHISPNRWPQLVGNHNGSEARIFSCPHDGSGFQLSGFSFQRGVVSLSCASVWSHDKSLCVHENHARDDRISKKIGGIHNILHGRHLCGSSDKNSVIASSRQYSGTHFSSSWLGSRGNEGMLGTQSMRPVFGNDGRPKTRRNMCSRRENAENKERCGRGGAFEEGYSPPIGKGGWNDKFCGQSNSYCPSIPKNDVSADRKRLQYSQKLGLSSDFNGGGEDRLNVDSDQHGSIQRGSLMASFTSNCTSNRCMSYGLGSHVGMHWRDGSWILSDSLGRHADPFKGDVGGSTRCKKLSTTTARQKGGSSNGQYDCTSVFGERGWTGQGNDKSRQIDLDGTSKSSCCDLFGGMGERMREWGGGQTFQIRRQGRLVHEKGVSKENSRGSSMFLCDRSFCIGRQRADDSIQRTRGLPQLRGSRRLLSRLESRRQLVGPSVSFDRPGSETNSRTACQRHYGDSLLAGSVLVPAAATHLGQGSGSGTCSSSLSSGTVRFFRTRKKQDMAVCSSSGGRGLSFDPEVVTRRKKELVEGALAVGTKATYKRWWDEFKQFLRDCGVYELEGVSSVEVGNFLVWLDLMGKGASAGVAKAAIAFFAQAQGLKDITQGFEVEKIVKALEKLAGNERQVRRRDPFPLKALKHYFEFGKLEKDWLRNITLVAIGFRTMRRASEIVNLRREDISEESDGTMSIKIRRSKTDQLGKGFTVRIEPTDSVICPVRVLKCYLEWWENNVRGQLDKDRWLFVKKNRQSGFVQLTSRDISLILQKMVDLAGCPEVVTSHSLRIGGATAALKGGLTKEQIMALGGWSSGAVERYLRDHELLQLAPSKRMGFAAF